jgi:hypothetical protein
MTRLLAAVFLGCGLAATAAELPAGPVRFGKLSAAPPADWKREKPKNRLRSDQFRLPSGEDGVADAELFVRPERNPDPAKSFPGWRAEFVPPEGKAAADLGSTKTFAAGGATVHLLDVSGTWRYKEFPMAKKEEERANYRVVWAIVAAGDEAWDVRLSGPEAVVGKHYPAFEAWLKGMK